MLLCGRFLINVRVTSITECVDKCGRHLANFALYAHLCRYLSMMNSAIVHLGD